MTTCCMGCNTLLQMRYIVIKMSFLKLHRRTPGIPKQQGCETLINSMTTVGLRITVFNRMHCNIKTTQVFDMNIMTNTERQQILKM